MTDEQRVPSTEFRVTFVRIREPVAVTVLGRVIGWWTPVPRPVQESGIPPARTEASDGFGHRPAVSLSSGSVAPETVAAPKGDRADGSTAPMTQAQRYEVLRRMAKGAG